MEIMPRIWVVLAVLCWGAEGEPRHIGQEPYYDSEEVAHHRYGSDDEDIPSSDPGLATYQRHDASRHHPLDPYGRPVAYQSVDNSYRQAEDPSYQSVYPKPDHSSRDQPEKVSPHPHESYRREESEYPASQGAGQGHYGRPEEPSSHPSPVPYDPKLPQYFTMYEKRIVQDPTDKYGKGPWRYLTYGHGITYGSKEPGKVFEKGYGYIRALGRDHCKMPKHLCPPKDEKPFEYEGRKEPYFGYRPH